MLRKEFNYYLAHQDELVKKYNGKFLVIKNENVIGVYDTDETALLTSQKDNELGTFLIQKCTPGKEAYTQVFHSRVSFN